MMTYSESDIAIVGMNCRYPGVHSVAEFETVLRTGRNILEPKVTPCDGYNQITLNNVYERMAEFDAGFFGYSRAEAEIMDPQQRVFLTCAWEMFEQSGYNPQQHDARVGPLCGREYQLLLAYPPDEQPRQARATRRSPNHGRQ
ncbi:iron aquisition yersiniabactin synthesis enzyme (Irp2) [Klebsiella michiganensis]|nr:iron aquisition yersiniabactin synthesis enzyme (Irp2) [Klebsiella michiganensis]